MPDRIYTAADKLKAVERELKYRRRVYARRIAEKLMTQDLANEQISIFEDIERDYRKLAEGERLL